MSNQKGSSPVLIILGIILLVGVAGSAYYLGMQKQDSSQDSQQDVEIQTTQLLPTTVPSSQPTQVVSGGKTSPTGQYIVTEETVGDGQVITIKDSNGTLIAENVISLNEKEIGYNTKIMCQCGTSFKNWVDNNSFSIKVVNGGGEEYEYIVDAATGKVRVSSFKKVN